MIKVLYKWLNWITPFLMLCIILSVFVSAYDYQTTVNMSDDLLDYYNFTLTSSTANNTIYLWFYKNYTSTTTDLSTLNSSYYFNQSGSSVNVSVMINISDVGDEDLFYTLFMNQTKSNLTINKTFFIDVFVPVPMWHDIEIGVYQYDICNYRLPENFTRSVTIGSDGGWLVNISADSSIFDIPNNITIGASNYTILNIKGTLPSSLSIGDHTKYIRFYFPDGAVENITFIFRIQDCGVLADWDKYIEACKDFDVNSAEYHYCYMTVLNQFQQQWLEDFAKRNNTVIINVTRNVTRYVEALRANQSVRDLIIAGKKIVARDAADVLQRDLDRIRMSDIETSITNMQDAIIAYPGMLNATAMSMYNKAEATRKEADKHGWLYYVFLTLVIIGSIVGISIYYYKLNYLY